MAPARSLPIDIHVSKLESWLLERNKIRAKWEVPAKARERLDQALARLPEDFDFESVIGKGVSESASALHDEAGVNYFEGVEILKLLAARSKDGGQRNWLGSYKDAELKEWESLLGAYKYGNAHLGEAARVMVQNTDFEVPALKSKLARNQKEVSDLMKKMQHSRHLIEENKRKYDEHCSSLGINGDRPDRIRDELSGLVRELRPRLLKIVDAVKAPALSSAIAYYEEVAEFLRNGAPEMGARRLAHLANVREAECVDDVVGKDMPEASKESSESVDVEAAGVGGVELDGMGLGGIDIGGMDLGGMGLGGIDMGGMDLSDVQMGGDIDWGISMDTADPAADGGAETGVAHELIDVEATGGSDKGEAASASSSLLDQTFRSRVLGDLLELRGFLSQRIIEIDHADKEGTAIFFRFDNAPASLENTGGADVSKYLDAVKDVADMFSDPHTLTLFMIKQKGSNFDALVSSFHQQLNRIAALERGIKQMETKLRQTQESSSKTHPQLDRIIKRTLGLKKATEASLSEMFGGTKVNIVGDINNL